MHKELDMAIEGNVLEVFATGKLETSDYELFSPAAEKLIEEYKKIRVIFVMHNFHGWSAGAMWEDIKFDLHHFKDIERLAIVGQSKWQKGMTVFCRPFTTAKMKYFDSTEMDAAREWIVE